MRRKLLNVLICLSVMVVLASCVGVSTSNNTSEEVPQSVSEEVADKSSPLLAGETEETVGSHKTEHADVKGVEKFSKKNESDEESVTDVSNSPNEGEKTENGVFKCSLSVICDDVFKNIDKLDKTKTEILPKDGVIFSETEVVFYGGESVFNVLAREMKKNKIHLDFVNTPMYNTVYIRGISNLYERDCGELSGWIYKVNGEVPGFGCSQYILNAGDKVEFLYTCNLG